MDDTDLSRVPHRLIAELARHLRATLRIAIKYRPVVAYAEGANELIHEACRLEKHLHRHEVPALAGLRRPPWIPAPRGLLSLQLRLLDDAEVPHDFALEYRLGDGPGKWDLADPEQCERLANSLRRNYLDWIDLRGEFPNGTR